METLADRRLPSSMTWGCRRQGPRLDHRSFPRKPAHRTQRTRQSRPGARSHGRVRRRRQCDNKPTVDADPLGNPAWSHPSVGLLPSVATAARRSRSGRDRMVVFGEGTPTTTTGVVFQGSRSGPNSLPPEGPPSVHISHTAIYDQPRDRMVVFGGWTGDIQYHDTWELTLAGTPTWSQLPPLVTPPFPSPYHTAICDPLRDRMVVFGGGIGFLNNRWAAQLWSPAWTQLVPEGSPPSGRHAHTAIYDPVRDRMVVRVRRGDSALSDSAGARLASGLVAAMKRSAPGTARSSGSISTGMASRRTPLRTQSGTGPPGNQADRPVQFAVPRRPRRRPGHGLGDYGN
jgi:hypothetical protein